MMQNSGQTSREILEIIREIPRSSTVDIATLCPHLRRRIVSATLNNLWRRGVVTREDGDTAQGARWSINPDPSQKPPPPVRRRSPTERRVAGSAPDLASQEREISELRAWKAQAIARYPDLAVAPEILQARAHVADVYKDLGDKARAADVLAGGMDNSPVMLVALRALNG